MSTIANDVTYSTSPSFVVWYSTDPLNPTLFFSGSTSTSSTFITLFVICSFQQYIDPYTPFQDLLVPFYVVKNTTILSEINTNTTYHQISSSSNFFTSPGLASYSGAINYYYLKDFYFSLVYGSNGILYYSLVIFYNYIPTTCTGDTAVCQDNTTCFSGSSTGQTEYIFTLVFIQPFEEGKPPNESFWKLDRVSINLTEGYADQIALFTPTVEALFKTYQQTFTASIVPNYLVQNLMHSWRFKEFLNFNQPFPLC